MFLSMEAEIESEPEDLSEGFTEYIRWIGKWSRGWVVTERGKKLLKHVEKK